MPWLGDALVLVVMVLAAFAAVLPVIPAAFVAAGAAVAWAWLVGGSAWWFAVGALAVIGIGQAIKFAIPGKQLNDSGVPGRSMIIAAGTGIAGFFLIPVVGLPVGFVGGAYLAELVRLGNHPAAWRSTKRALAAVGWSMLIELASLLFAAGIIAVGVAVT